MFEARGHLLGDSWRNHGACRSADKTSGGSKRKDKTLDAAHTWTIRAGEDRWRREREPFGFPGPVVVTAGDRCLGRVSSGTESCLDRAIRFPGERVMRVCRHGASLSLRWAECSYSSAYLQFFHF